MPDDKTLYSDRYWQFEQLEEYGDLSKDQMKALLKDREYAYPKRADKGALRLCLRRSDLGMLCYDKLSYDEMKDLLRRRGIEEEGGLAKDTSRARLVNILERADYNKTLDNFIQLPPELRARIYRYYFAEFKKPLHAPIQPPLTCTCKLIRKEALPLFYASCIFRLHLRPAISYDRTRERKSSTRRLRPLQETSSWLHQTRAENMADIQRIAITVGRISRPYTDQGFIVHIDSTQGSHVSDEYWTRLPHANLTVDLSQIVETIKRRSKGWQVEREDFYVLRDAVERNTNFW